MALPEIMPLCVFQSTLPRGERPDKIVKIGVFGDFNPRSREGSDLISLLLKLMMHDFNPRSREGSDITILSCFFRIPDFNPRSREGSDSLEKLHLTHGANFNPRSREGSDHRSAQRISCMGISIHAPARGATMVPVLQRWRLPISIHAPARGATIRICDGNCRKKYFNPRSREGSDHQDQTNRPKSYYFNPRSREGSDSESCTNFEVQDNFNPRSREGSDILSRQGR